MKRLAGTALVLALLVPASAAAQTELPVGEAHGVRLVRQHDGHRVLVLVFTDRADKLFKRIAGKRIDMSCTELGEDSIGVEEGDVEVPRRRRRFSTGDASRGMDFCRLWLPARTIKHRRFIERRPRRVLVSIPLTQAGAVYLDEEAKTFSMLGASVLSGFVKRDLKLSGYPTYEQLVQAEPSAAKRIIKLAAPGDTPPANKVGYYSDGAEHVALVTVSSSGRRLFIEADVDEVLRTNVAKYFVGERH
jgi:hypothetical protein